MANYYTNFSLILELPNKEAQQRALEIVAQVSRIQDAQTDRVKNEEILSGTFPECLRDFMDNWWFEAEAENNEAAGKWGIWLHSENGGIDAVCAFIQYLLQKFDPERRVALEWSNDCSKPRLDAFGGGAALITAKRIKSMNTADWLRRQGA